MAGRRANVSGESDGLVHNEGEVSAKAENKPQIASWVKSSWHNISTQEYPFNINVQDAELHILMTKSSGWRDGREIGWRTPG